MQNARLTDRAPFMAEVDVLSLGHTTPRRLWGVDVCEEGMFLQTTHPFRVGDRVSLRFGVQVGGAEEHEVHVRAAEVRWVRAFEPVAVDGKLPGIGLQFVSIDPPARAALRRFMMPSERDDITLPERAAPGDTLDSGGDLGMLPPPNASLPPITGSIARAATTTPREITEEMFAVSLPPFSTPPRAPRPEDQRTSLPPDEDIDAGFASTALSQLRSKPPVPSPRDIPRDVTMLPRARSQKPVHATQPPLHAVTDPPSIASVFADASEADGQNALAAWRFEKVIYDDAPASPHTEPPTNASAPPAQVSTPPREADDSVTVRAFMSDKPMKLGLSFDDDRPAEHRSQLPSMIVEPSILSMESTPPQEGSSGPTPAFEEAFLRGEIALADLPTVSERAPSQRATRHAKSRPPTPHAARRSGSRALPTALALIVVGTAVGAGLGVLGKRIAKAGAAPVAAHSVQSPAAKHAANGAANGAAIDAASAATPAVALAPAAAATESALRSVADVERGVPARAMPELLAPPDKRPALAPIVVAAAPKTEAKPDAKAEPKAEPKADMKADVKVDAKVDAKVAAKPAPKPAASAPSGFKLDIPVGDASVARTFTLSAPNRVVVDLDGGTLPKAALDGDGKRTKRVRFGTPKPGMGRVVVELADGVTASDVAADVNDGRLALSFR